MAFLAGCTPSSPPEARAALLDADCGLRGAMRRYLPRPPGSSPPPVEPGDAVRACAPPSEAEIAHACAWAEARPIPGSQSPDNPDAPRYSVPAYRVADILCAYVDRTRSAADCRFSLVEGEEAPRPASARLVYRFRDLSDEVLHGHYHTSWEAESVCRPAR